MTDQHGCPNVPQLHQPPKRPPHQASVTVREEAGGGGMGRGGAGHWGGAWLVLMMLLTRPAAPATTLSPDLHEDYGKYSNNTFHCCGNSVYMRENIRGVITLHYIILIYAEYLDLHKIPKKSTALSTHISLGHA